MASFDSRVAKIVARALPTFKTVLQNAERCLVESDICHVSIVCLESRGFGTVFSYVSLESLRVRPSFVLLLIHSDNAVSDVQHVFLPDEAAPQSPIVT